MNTESVRANWQIWHNTRSRLAYVCDNCADRITAGEEANNEAWDANKPESIPYHEQLIWSRRKGAFVYRACWFIQHPAPRATTSRRTASVPRL